MILRRISDQVRAQNWSAVAIELCIVVLGVYLGLQAQDWSTDRAERAAEREALGRLIAEYKLNLELLEADKEKSEQSFNGTLELLAMFSPDPGEIILDAALARSFMDCMRNGKFVPALGTTNSLIASGDLRLIRDPEIQSLLTQWPATVQVLVEWQEIERMHGEELILGFTHDYVAWPTLLALIDLGGRSSKLSSDLRPLFSSLRFEGLLTNRRYNINSAIERLEELQETTQELVDRMAARYEMLVGS